MKIIIFVLLAAIVISLSTALFHLSRDESDSKQGSEDSANQGGIIYNPDSVSSRALKYFPGMTTSSRRVLE